MAAASRAGRTPAAPPAAAGPGLPPLLRALQGGDRRSVAGVDAVVTQVLREPTLAGTLLTGLRSGDAVVAMRCADALEKVSRTLPGVLGPMQAELLALLGEPVAAEVHWHLLQMAPRIGWSSDDLPRVLAAIRAALGSASAIVQVSAMQAAADFARDGRIAPGAATRIVERAMAAGGKAVQARGRRLLQQLRSD
jgi:hypothetical protein